MKTPYIAFLSTLAILLFLWEPAAGQISYDNWNFQIRGMNSALTDSLAMLGVRPDATSGFDNIYDIPRPPRPPSGQYVEVYFPHSGGNYPPLLGSKYAADFLGPSDPSWNMSVEASLAGPLTLLWDSSYVSSIEPRVQLFLYDITGGTLVNMRTAGSYTFNYSVKRNFQIFGAIKINLTILMEGFWNGTSQVQDTITAYLAGAQAPHGFADSVNVPLSGTGTGFAIFRYAPSGAYYLAIRHRNHLEVWSADSLPLVKGTTSTSSYDFSTDAGKAYGTTALKQVGSVFVTWGGDVNQDGVIDYRDRNLTWNNRGLNGYISTDCNGDGTCDSADYAIVLANRLRVLQRP
jgi:hypothetical protein